MCIICVGFMRDSENIPFEQLASDCEVVNCHNPKESISKISALNAFYPNEYLVLIYNYFFEIADNFEIINFLLQKIDKFKDKTSRSVLIDTLVIKTKLSNRISDVDNLTRIRVNITKALANTKDSQAVYPLLYCLNNENENYKVKLACAEALGKIGDRYAVLPLMNIVEDESEKSIYVKESAVSALGMIGDEKAVDSLVSIIDTKSNFLSKFTFLKERALEALNKLSFKCDKVFKAAEKSLNDESPQVRINAIEVLMNSEDERAVDLIKNMLNDSSADVVQNAVIALYNLLGDEILEQIVNSRETTHIARNEALKLQDNLKDEEFEEEEDENDSNED